METNHANRLLKYFVQTYKLSQNIILDVNKIIQRKNYQEF